MPAPSGFQLRPARPDDARAMLEIYGPFIESSPVTFETEMPTPAEFAQRIQKIASERPWLVAMDGEVLAGYAYASEHRARIAYQWATEVSVYVREEYRRSGVGRILYTRLFELLRKRGFFIALAGVTIPNPSSVAFHESFGFRPIGVYRGIGYKQGVWHDVGWWQLALREPILDPPPPVKHSSTF